MDAEPSTSDSINPPTSIIPGSSLVKQYFGLASNIVHHAPVPVFVMATEAFTISRDQLKGSEASTILITGGSAGIGLETAIIWLSLSDENNVVILDRAAPHPSFAEAHKGSQRVLYHQCDITSWQSQRGGFAAAVEKFGAIDAVFVNAGVAEYKDQMFNEDLDQDRQLAEPDRRTIDIDMQAANDTVKLAIYHLKNRKDGKKGGSIVLTASLAGYLASAGAPLYSAAKHGIVGLMRALKNDTATLGIAISVVGPGITLTNLVSGVKPGQSLDDWAKEMRGRGVPINSPQEVATAVVWLMGLGMEANGKGLVIQAGKVADVEAGIAKSRKVWMGEEMLSLFKGGRNAPLFPNKL